MPTNPVVVRRVTAMLGKAGLVGATRGLADPPPDTFQLDAVLRAVDGRTKLGVPPKGVDGCPVGAKIPDTVRRAIAAAYEAATARLSAISVDDLLKD